MKNQSVSILTITNIELIDLLKILFLSLVNQSYKNIKEWIILDTSINEDDFISTKLLLNDYIRYNQINNQNQTKINIQYLNVSNIKTIGSIKNYANTMASGDIIAWCSVYDYQFPSRINNIAEKLSKSDKLLVGSQNIYFYDQLNNSIKKVK